MTTAKIIPLQSASYTTRLKLLLVLLLLLLLLYLYTPHYRLAEWHV